MSQGNKDGSKRAMMNNKGIEQLVEKYTPV
jgi:hypothetical protein